MNYRPMFEAIRIGAAVPVEYIDELIFGRDDEKKAIIDDLNFVINGNSKIRVFVGDYGFGKTSLARYAEHQAIEKGMVISYLSEKDYDEFHKQDELFKSIMKNLTLFGIDGNPIRIFLDGWAQEKSELIKNSGTELKTVEETKNYILKDSENFSDGLFAQFCSAYLFKVLNNESVEELIAYIMGESVDKRFLKRNGIYHFLANDGWNFLKAFTVLMKNISIPGLLIVMDEMESFIHKRSDLRKKSYNQLREMVDTLNSGKLSGIYSVWLGTPLWFNNNYKGIRSNTALFNRLTNLSGKQTNQSILMNLNPITLGDIENLVNKLVGDYQQVYSINIPAEKTKKIYDFLIENYKGIEGEVRVSTREISKHAVELFDLIKENPDMSMNDILNIEVDTTEERKKETSVNELW